MPLLYNNIMQQNHQQSVAIKFEQHSGVRSGQRDLDEMRKVYDNIHGFIYFPQIVWNFVDTPHFQRLRNIKQLGCLQYVFPGATHTRFEHSLGTAHLAYTFLKTLIENNKEYYRDQDTQSALLTITIAGLLHDLGHGPYSHTFDNHIVTQIHKKGEEKPIKWTHELASDELFMSLINKEGLSKYLKPHEIQRIRALINGQKDGVRDWQFHLISNKRNGIDVDKLDYFRRDAFHLGAKNIFIDHDLLIHEARIIQTKQNGVVESEICYPTKYVQMVYNIFHSRYKLYKNYYFNLVSKSIQLMICDILEEINVKYNFRSICEIMFEDPKDYIKLTDNILEKVDDINDEINNDPKCPNAKYRKQFETAAHILGRIRRRKLYRFVKEFHYFIHEGTNEDVIKMFKEEFKKEKIIKAISEESKVPASKICIGISEIGFGLKEANPLNKVGFFRKELREKKPTKLDPKQIPNLTMLYTQTYLERSIKVFIKEDDPDTYSKVDEAFTRYCKQINQDFQTNFKELGVCIIFEGRGGNTPHFARQQNTKSVTVKANPLPVFKM